VGSRQAEMGAIVLRRSTEPDDRGTELTKSLGETALREASAAPTSRAAPRSASVVALAGTPSAAKLVSCAVTVIVPSDARLRLVWHRARPREPSWCPVLFLA
jgi:hypothetical protein